MSGLVNIKPNVEIITLSPYNESFQKLITTKIIESVGLSINEIGYHGSAAWINRKSNKRMVLSKFDLDKVAVKMSKGFGGNDKYELRSEMRSLENKFYYGDIDDYIYEMNHKSGIVIMKWHNDLAFAHITDTSLLDEKYRIRHVIIEKDKNKKDDHVPAMFEIYRTHSGIKESKYDPDEADQFFANLVNP